MNQGFIFEKIKQYDKAYEYYQYCLLDSLSPSIIKTHRNLANLHALKNEDNKAREHYHKSISTAIKIFGTSSHDLGLSYMYMGKFLAEKNDSSCLQYLESARIIFYEIFGNRNRDIAMTLNFTGSYLAHQGKNLEAINAYNNCIKAAGYGQLSAGNEEADPTEVSSDIAALAYGNMAKVFLERYLHNEPHLPHLVRSLGLFDTAIAINRSIREAYQTDDSKLIAIEDFHFFHQLAVYNALLLYKLTGDKSYLEKGFGFSEKARASQLFQAIREADAKIDAGIPSPLLSREREIKVNLASYSHLLHKEIRKPNPDSTKIDLWRHEFFNLKKSYDSIITLYEKHYPDYYFLKYDTAVVAAGDLSRSLKRDEVLLEYMLIDSLIVGFCLENDDIHSFVQENNGELQEQFRLLSKYQRLPALIFYDSASHQQYLDTLAGLYRLLIAPFEDEIQGKKLIIVRDQFLSYIPFEILIRTPGKVNSLDFITPDYLLRYHAVSYTPSASIFYHYNNSSGVPRKTMQLLAVAPEYKSGKLSGSVDLNASGLNDLPGAISEAHEIAGLYMSNTLIGPEATETAFKLLAPQYDLLHCALHTQINDESPMYSRLIFSVEGDTVNDGNLNTYEIFNMNLDGEQVVMSSCRSGTGMIRPGEGMMNLVRAFQYTGFLSVIATLWDVEDESSGGLMKKYYSLLSKGWDKSEAMRQAKLSYVENAAGIKAHPYFWAGYIHYGSSAPITTFRAQTSLLLLIFVVVLTLLYFLFDRYQQGK